MNIQLRNPHSVMAAIHKRPQDVLEIRLRSNRPSPAWTETAELAKSKGISVRRGGGGSREGRRGPRRETERVGSAEATVKSLEGVSLNHLFANAESRANGSGVWLALDCLQDLHNVGAIFRTASFFGVEGIILTRDKSAPLNHTVYDIAAGGIESVPFSVQTNLSRTLSQAKESGVWVLGTSEHADDDLKTIDRDRPWLVVVGNEEKGLRRLTLTKCDCVCRIPGNGDVTSLNVSVASGIMMATLCGAG